MAVASVSLPHGFRPAVDATTQLPASGLPWISWLILAALVLLGVTLLWRQQRRQRQGLLEVVTDSPDDAWAQLERTVGSSDWYQRLGAHLLAEAQRTDRTVRSLDDLLTQAAQQDTSKAWQLLRRRWEWATFAGHPGQASEHATDLATARQGWPRREGSRQV